MVLTSTGTLKTHIHIVNTNIYTGPTTNKQSPTTNTIPWLSILQYTRNTNKTTHIHTKEMQQIIGSTLYLSSTISPTIIYTVSRISAYITNPKIYTHQQIHQLLNYLRTNWNPSITYSNSNMQLHSHCDSSYLQEKIKKHIRIPHVSGKLSQPHNSSIS